MAKRVVYVIEIKYESKRSPTEWLPWHAEATLRRARVLRDKAIEHDGKGMHRITRYVPETGGTP